MSRSLSGRNDGDSTVGIGAPEGVRERGSVNTRSSSSHHHVS